MSRGRGRDVGSEDGQVRIRQGRRAPYTQLGDWVMLAPSSIVRPPAKVLYWALSSHLTVKQADDEVALTVSPTLAMLAEMLGYSRPDKLLPYLGDLVALGAIEIDTEFVIGEGARRRNTYTIHQSPPEDYEHHETLGEFYRAFRARRDAERAARRAARIAAAAPDIEAPANPRNGEPGPDPRNGEPGPDSRDGGSDIEQDEGTRRRNKIGGRDAAPRTPASRSAGRVTSLVPMGGDQQGDQQTARADAHASASTTPPRIDTPPVRTAVRRSPGTSHTIPRRVPVRRSTRRTALGTPPRR